MPTTHAKIFLNGGVSEGWFDDQALREFFLDVARGGQKSHVLVKEPFGILMCDAACVTGLELSGDQVKILAWMAELTAPAPAPKDEPPPEPDRLHTKPPADPGPQAIDLAFLGLNKEILP